MMEPSCQPSVTVKNCFSPTNMFVQSFPRFGRSTNQCEVVTPVKNVVGVARRNARERRRIKHVNSAFDDLRKRVPCESDYRKISKVETLRSAIEYIKALEAVVEKQRATRDRRTPSTYESDVSAAQERAVFVAEKESTDVVSAEESTHPRATINNVTTYLFQKNYTVESTTSVAEYVGNTEQAVGGVEEENFSDPEFFDRLVYNQFETSPTQNGYGDPTGQVDV